MVHKLGPERGEQLRVSGKSEGAFFVFRQPIGNQLGKANR